MEPELDNEESRHTVVLPYLGFDPGLYTGCLRSNGKKFKDENYTLV
jgi:hypothetical protein